MEIWLQSKNFPTSFSPSPHLPIIPPLFFPPHPFLSPCTMTPSPSKEEEEGAISDEEDEEEEEEGDEGGDMGMEGGGGGEGGERHPLSRKTSAAKNSEVKKERRKVGKKRSTSRGENVSSFSSSPPCLADVA